VLSPLKNALIESRQLLGPSGRSASWCWIAMRQTYLCHPVGSDSSAGLGHVTF
jgi:hypothetical protein